MNRHQHCTPIVVGAALAANRSGRKPVVGAALAANGSGLKPLLQLLSPVFLATAMLAAPAQAQNFDTLFTSADEREYLDYLREENLRLSQQNNFNIQEDVIPDIPVAVEEVETETGPAITEYKFGGIMERLNGSRMVWLNGRQIAENELPGNMSLQETAGSLLLNIRSEGNSYLLKPGQTYDVLSGTVMDSFQTTPPPASQGTQTDNDNTTVEPAQDNSTLTQAIRSEEPAVIPEPAETGIDAPELDFNDPDIAELIDAVIKAREGNSNVP